MYKNILLGLTVVKLCLLSGLAGAEETMQAAPEWNTQTIYQLIEDRGYRCLECHDVNETVVGPSWKEVAAKRKSDKWAHELLAFKISSGSLGEYGTVQMPHNEVQDEDVRVIVNWILSLWDSNQ